LQLWEAKAMQTLPIRNDPADMLRIQPKKGTASEGVVELRGSHSTKYTAGFPHGLFDFVYTWGGAEIV
jgi:hypothetical protein